MCEFFGCNIYPAYAKPGETRKRCKKHRQEGDVNVKDITCEFIGCYIRPIFAKAGEKAKRCKKHIQEGDVNIKHITCEFIGCDIRPIFAKAGEKPKRCKKHIQEGDVNINHKRCISEYCMVLSDKYSRGFASRINPKTGKKEFCYKCHFKLEPTYLN